MLSPEQIRELGKQSQRKIFEGSKSFSLASLLLSKSEKQGTHFLYRWCRYCDDEMDNERLQESVAELQEKLSWLQEETQKSIDGNPAPHPIFSGLTFVINKYHIPPYYLFELLEGMRMDIEKKEYATFEELKIYCYRVAGVVGLMMCHIIGVSDDEALGPACELGMAMQLTNIARDIRADFHLGRLYLPLNWLSEEGLTRETFSLPENSTKAFRVVVRLLDQAEKRYALGLQGLKYLSWRARFSIAAAALIYKDIGREILANRNLEERVWVSFPRKIFLIFKSLLWVPRFTLKPWRKKELTLTLKHP